MTKLDIQALSDAAQVARAIKTNSMTLAKALVEKIKSAGYTQEQLACIGDVLVTNTFMHITEVHDYFLTHLEELPDRQALWRVARAKRMFDEDTETRAAFLQEMVTEEKMFTGHATDFFFASLLIRLAMADENYDTVVRIQELLDEHKKGAE